MGHVRSFPVTECFAHSSDGQTWNMPPRRGLVATLPSASAFPVGARDRDV